MTQVIDYNENNYSEFEWFDGFAVIRFYAEWCAPCVQNFPVFSELAGYYAHHQPEIKFGTINVDQSPILTLSVGLECTNSVGGGGFDVPDAMVVLVWTCSCPARM